MDAGSGSDDLERAIDALLIEHDRAGSPLRAFLRPGVEPARLASVLGAAVGTAAPLLASWYGRFDGIDQAAYEATRGKRVALGLFPLGFPLTLVDASETFSDLREQAERLGEWTQRQSDDYWKRSWWPIITAEPATIAVDAGGSVDRIEWDPERGPVVDTLCPSLGAFLTAIADGFRSGTYVWSEDAGVLQMSDPAATPAPPSCGGG
jgi:hypothetical protein